jgi:hypothetical protein
VLKVLYFIESKRQKVGKQAAMQSLSKDQWIQLATLYNSINEHEIFSSLYAEQIASKEKATGKSVVYLATFNA